MRGEGTRADVSRSIAESRVWRSCTLLFHHGSGGIAKKQRRDAHRRAL